jgi:hypothetical protein
MERCLKVTLGKSHSFFLKYCAKQYNALYESWFLRLKYGKMSNIDLGEVTFIFS